MTMKANFDQRTRDRIDLSTWNLDAVSSLQEAIEEVAFRAINEAFESAVAQDADISLPFVWGDSDGAGGPPMKDPLTIEISLPLGREECEEPEWRLSFSELMRREVNEIDGNFSERDVEILDAWKSELLALVAIIDKQKEIVAANSTVTD